MTSTVLTTHLARVASGALLVAGTVVGCSSSSSEADEPVSTSTAGAESAEPEVSEEPEVETPDPLAEQAAALDAYVEGLRTQIPNMEATFAELYSSIDTVAVPPGAIEYSYVYVEQLDAAATATGLDTMIETLQTTCDDTLFPEMEAAGVTVDPKVIYTYYNADGAQIWSHTFERS